MVVLTGWMLVSAGRGRLKVMIPLLLVTGLLAMTGRFVLEKAEEWIGRAGGHGRGVFDPNFANTLIGTIGVVQQSPDIVWRLQAAPRQRAAAPVAHRFVQHVISARIGRTSGCPTPTSAISTPGSSARIAYYLLNEHWIGNDPSLLTAFTLRGAVNAKSPLPLAR